MRWYHRSPIADIGHIRRQPWYYCVRTAVFDIDNVSSPNFHPPPELLPLYFTLLQTILLEATMFDTFDCLAAADVLVGSESSFSEATAAVSTNVKVMIWRGEHEQDRVTLNPNVALSSGDVTLAEQKRMDDAIADWWHCSEETRRSTGDDANSVAARQFYQTVDGSAKSR